MKEGKKGKKKKKKKKKLWNSNQTSLSEKTNLNKEMLEKDCRGNQIYEALQGRPCYKTY